MASDVDICNLALSHLGDEAGVSAISPPDGSAQADHCKRFYPVARDALLEMHNWGFAMGRQALALLSDTGQPYGWTYSYARPDCLRVIAVYPTDTVTAAGQGYIFDKDEFIARVKEHPFVEETDSTDARVIYSNIPEASALFIRKVTDTNRFSPLFVVALSRLLAAYLAGAIIKGDAGMKVSRAHMEVFERVEGPRAKAHDAMSGRNTSYDDFVPSSLLARA